MTIYDQSIFDHAGFTFRVNILHDEHHGAPWDESDGHGPVSDWTTRAKRPGELVLCRDRQAHRYYDFQAACRLAFRDGWGAPGDNGMTPRQRASHAALANFEYLRRWCADLWCWVGVTVELLDDEEEGTGEESYGLWGIESDAHEYLEQVARELADELLATLQSRAAAA